MSNIPARLEAMARRIHGLSIQNGDEMREMAKELRTRGQGRDGLTSLPSTDQELADARAVIIEANNSLYGSQGFFLSTNGGPPDKYHLARPIEELKARARRASTDQTWNEAIEAAARAVENGSFLHDQSPAAKFAKEAAAAIRALTKGGAK